MKINFIIKVFFIFFAVNSKTNVQYFFIEKMSLVKGLLEIGYGRFLGGNPSNFGKVLYKYFQIKN